MLEVSFVILSTDLVILANKNTRLNHSQLNVSSIDLTLPKLENLNKKKKNISPFRFGPDQMKIMKHILQHIEVIYY